jgi:hypothetical protein
LKCGNPNCAIARKQCSTAVRGNRGARLEVAAADFATAEDFMTVAHAARNTSVPFMVLKHRVLDEGQTLADAIRDYNPAVDAKAESARARTAARSDLTD